jgi:hypothetical protein
MPAKTKAVALGIGNGKGYYLITGNDGQRGWDGGINGSSVNGRAPVVIGGSNGIEACYNYFRFHAIGERTRHILLAVPKNQQRHAHLLIYFREHC